MPPGSYWPYDSLRSAALEEWGRLRGTPYRWGGEGANAWDARDWGIDCSGFARHGLIATGRIPREPDRSAHDLLHITFRDRLRFTMPQQIKPGMLLFWANDAGRVYHVEVAWSVEGDSVLTIGAAGGGRTTTDLDAAARDDAFVRIRPAKSGWVAVDPFDS